MLYLHHVLTVVQGILFVAFCGIFLIVQSVYVIYSSIPCEIIDEFCCNKSYVGYHIIGFNGDGIKQFIRKFFNENKSSSTGTLTNTDSARQLSDEIKKQFTFTLFKYASK